MERNKLQRYYTFTKIFYFIWFVLSALMIGAMFKDVFAGDIYDRNIVFQIFFAIIFLIAGFAFRNLNFLLKDILQEDKFTFHYLDKISSLIKMMMVVVFLFGCISYDGGVGLDRINLSPDMILTLAGFAFLLIVFKLFSVYREMAQEK
nr:hypothetical protein [uncultured Peptoniphilus sp.]